MIRSVRVALMGVASLVLLAAGEVPELIADQTAARAVEAPQVQPAALATPAPTLDVAFEEDDTLAAPEASSEPSGGSLRELVNAITALPSIEFDEEMRCLATAVYYESKGEPLDGQLAVAQVILNRVESGRFASDICGVVYQRGQFSFTWDKRPDRPSESPMWRTAQAIAVIAATDNWREVVPEATHFHATRVAPGWRGLQRVASVGNHVFYRMR